MAAARQTEIGDRHGLGSSAWPRFRATRHSPLLLGVETRPRAAQWPDLNGHRKVIGNDGQTLQRVPIELEASDEEPPQQPEVLQRDPKFEVVRDRSSILPRGRRFKSCPRYSSGPWIQWIHGPVWFGDLIVWAETVQILGLTVWRRGLPRNLCPSLLDVARCGVHAGTPADHGDEHNSERPGAGLLHERVTVSVRPRGRRLEP